MCGVEWVLRLAAWSLVRSVESHEWRKIFLHYVASAFEVSNCFLDVSATWGRSSSGGWGGLVQPEILSNILGTRSDFCVAPVRAGFTPGVRARDGVEQVVLLEVVDVAVELKGSPHAPVAWVKYLAPSRELGRTFVLHPHENCSPYSFLVSRPPVLCPTVSDHDAPVICYLVGGRLYELLLHGGELHGRELAREEGLHSGGFLVFSELFHPGLEVELAVHRGEGQLEQ